MSIPQGTATAHISLQGPTPEAKPSQLATATQPGFWQYVLKAVNFFLIVFLSFGIAAYYFDQACSRTSFAAAQIWTGLLQLYSSSASTASSSRAAAARHFNQLKQLTSQLQMSAMNGFDKVKQFSTAAAYTVWSVIVFVITLGQLTPTAVRWRSVIIDSSQQHWARFTSSTRFYCHTAVACLKAYWRSAAAQTVRQGSLALQRLNKGRVLLVSSCWSTWCTAVAWLKASKLQVTVSVGVAKVVVANTAHVVKSKTRSACAATKSSAATMLKLMRQSFTKAVKGMQSAWSCTAAITATLAAAATSKAASARAGCAKLPAASITMTQSVLTSVTASSTRAGSTAYSFCSVTAATSYWALMSLHARLEMLCPALGIMAPAMTTMVGLMWLDPEAALSVCAFLTMVLLLYVVSQTWPAHSIAASIRSAARTTAPAAAAPAVMTSSSGSLPGQRPAAVHMLQALLSLPVRMEALWPHIKLLGLLTFAAVVIHGLEAAGALCIVIGTTLTLYQAALQGQAEPAPPSRASAVASEVASEAAATAAEGPPSGTTPSRSPAAALATLQGAPTAAAASRQSRTASSAAAASTADAAPPVAASERAHPVLVANAASPMASAAAGQAAPDASISRASRRAEAIRAAHVSFHCLLVQECCSRECVD